MDSITVYSPASVSNLCCGFDILGMALDEPYDIMQITKHEDARIVIRHTDDYGLPPDINKNIAGVALKAICAAAGYKGGFDVVISKHIKPGSGIGSSAASAAGIVVAINELLGKIFTKKELIQFAMEVEVIASGAKHADNLAPCIYGGLVLIRDTKTLDIISLEAPPLFITVVHPQIEIKTSYARSILPAQVSLQTAITQWANVAGLVTGFLKNDYGLISRSLQDVVAEPVRSKLIPGFDAVKAGSMAAGALGGGISGSGPSLFMLSETRGIAEKVELVMKHIYEELRIDYKSYVSCINKEGVRIKK